MLMVEGLGRLLRKSWTWNYFRRAQVEGFRASLQRHRLWIRILQTDPIRTDAQNSSQAVEVHLLCFWRDYLTAIWALKTFYWQSGVKYPLIIHTNGRMPSGALQRLKSHFPDARIIEQSEADFFVERYLKDHSFHRVLKARSVNGFMLKLTDLVLLGQATNILSLDTDVLFFSEPAELRLGETGKLAQHWFQRDRADAYNVTQEYARKLLQIELQPCLNSGIMLFNRDLAVLETYEALLADSNVAKSTAWIEQTLFALQASSTGRAATLPETYQLTFEPGLIQGVVARHYAGPSRQLLTQEGIPALLERGLCRSVTSDRRTSSGEPIRS